MKQSRPSFGPVLLLLSGSIKCLQGRPVVAHQRCAALKENCRAVACRRRICRNGRGGPKGPPYGIFEICAGSPCSGCHFSLVLRGPPRTAAPTTSPTKTERRAGTCAPPPLRSENRRPTGGRPTANMKQSANSPNNDHRFRPFRAGAS